MLKRILSVFLSVLMISAMLTIPGISASAASKPASTVVVQAWDNVLGITTSKNVPAYPYATVTAPSELDNKDAIYLVQNNTPGLGVQFSIAANTLVAGESYVLSYKVTNANPDIDATVVAGLVDGTGKLSKNDVWTDVITGSEEQVITRTITLASTDAQTTKSMLRIGLGIGNTHTWFAGREDLAFVPNSKIVLKYDDVYFAKEVVYEMTTSLNEDIVIPGKTITGSADVLNQGGQKGTLDQTIVSRVTTIDGADAEGFTVVSGADGAYTIKASANAVPGNYKIVLSNNTNGETVEAEAEFIVAEKYLYDSEEGTDPLYGIEITAGGDYPNVLGAFGSYTMTASLTDSNGEIGTNVQNFKWYAVTEDRASLAENFVITPAGDTKTATVKVNPEVAEGTYYIIAESTADESLGMLKGFEITVDKSKDIEAFAALLKSDEADAKDRVSQTLETSIKVLELADTVVSSADAETLIGLLMANADDATLDTKENIAKYVVQNAIISLYNKNPESIALYDAEGNFTYETELALSDIDKDDVTIWNLFEEVISEDGISKVHSALAERTDYAGYLDLMEEIKLAILLETLENPAGLGTGYVEKVLTEENLDAVGIDATGYLALDDDDKKVINADLARNEYTKEQLEEILKNAEAPEEEEEDEDETPSRVSRPSGGFGGSITTKETPKEEEKATVKEFTDVPATHWAYSDIYFLREIGAVSGITEDTFDPEGIVTREQFLKMIIDALKIPHANATSEFGDVVSGSWYKIYVDTGVAEGITTGKNSMTFGVGESITRQDACTMLVRALGLETKENATVSFKDADTIAPYAMGSVAILTEYAVIHGYDNNTFGSLDVCTRAQAAKIIAKAVNVANVINK